MRVLICGGRRYNDWQHFNKHVTRLHIARRFSTIIHGGATGADWFAQVWADNHRTVTQEEYPITQADWRKLGRAAGPRRNQRMIDEGRPELVIAFPGGTGTADMVRRAKAAEIEVVEIEG